MSNLLLGWPIYSDAGELYTPTFDSGGWRDQLPRENLNNPELAYRARSLSAELVDTRCRVDLKADRQVGLIALPGAMTGLILAGVDPIDAVRVQASVMYLILGSVATTTTVVALGIRRRLFTPDHRLRRIAGG